MLVFGRKQGEVVCIGESIRVRILEIRGRRIKIAIEAPDTIVIRRGEHLLEAGASNDGRLTQG